MTDQHDRIRKWLATRKSSEGGNPRVVGPLAWSSDDDGADDWSGWSDWSNYWLGDSIFSYAYLKTTEGLLWTPCLVKPMRVSVGEEAIWSETTFEEAKRRAEDMVDALLFAVRGEHIVVDGCVFPRPVPTAKFRASRRNMDFA